MSGAGDFRTLLPVADVRLGPTQHVRIYGEAATTLGLPLVEFWLHRRDQDEVLNLTVDQADAIAAGLLAAAAKARGC